MAASPLAMSISGVTTIPQKYVFPVEQRPLLSQVREASELPLIDISGLLGDDKSRVAAEIHRACVEWGVFEMINHGVSQATQDRLLSAARSFFEEPEEERMKYYAPAAFLDSDAVYSISNNSSLTAATRWIDTLTFRFHGNEFQGFKNGPKSCRTCAGEYVKEIGILIKKVYSALSQSLHVEENCLETAMGDNPKTALLLNYYPICPNAEQTYGQRPHYDPDASMIILQDKVAGLQVFKDEQWQEIKPRRGALIFIVGDPLKVLTNGRIKSAYHRVVVSPVQERLSIACSFAPGNEVLLGPLPHFIDTNNPPLFEKIAYKKFFDDYMKSL